MPSVKITQPLLTLFEGERRPLTKQVKGEILGHKIGRGS